MPRLLLSQDFPSPVYNDHLVVGWAKGTEQDVTDEHATFLLEKMQPYFTLVSGSVSNRAVKAAPVTKDVKGSG